jgi:hypothetical protein
MAWAFVAGSGTGNHKTASTTWSIGTLSGLTAGEIIVLCLATDNIETGDGNTNNHQSISNTSGATWEKIYEFTNGQGAAAAGATVSAWRTVAPGSSISTNVINFSGSITAKAYIAARFAIGSGNLVGMPATPATRADDGVDPGSMTLSGLTSAEYLWMRVISGETSSTSQITATTGWSVWNFNQTSGGGSASNIAVRAEYRIATSSSETSDPTWTSADHASILFALSEESPPEMIALQKSPRVVPVQAIERSRRW